jgi:4-aminobutyrate aminotransferase/(S)-3-amino-2-methylpropionate transaminase
MALTAKSMPYKHRFGPFAPEVYRAPMSYPYRDGLSGEEAAKKAISVLESQIGASNLAAVLIEPVQGEGGFIVPAKGFLPAIAKWCTDNGVLFIADEIQSGFCRTGDWFALDDEGVKADLVTTAKGIAGGMPLAAVTGRADIMDAIHEGGLGGTYGGNPVACAAALAAISVMRRDELGMRARTIGKAMISILRTLSEDLPRIGEVRGRGAMVAIELVTGPDKTPDAQAAKSIANLCNQAGVIVLTCGTYGNVIRLLPPLAITDEQLHDGLTVLACALREVLA